MGCSLRMRPKLVLCVALALLCGAAAKVTVLTQENFDSETKNGLWLVKFYAPWCGHCQALEPVIEEASGQVEGILRIGEPPANPVCFHELHGI